MRGNRLAAPLDGIAPFTHELQKTHATGAQLQWRHDQQPAPQSERALAEIVSLVCLRAAARALL